MRDSRCIFRCQALVEHGLPMHRFPNPDKRPDLFDAWVSAVGDKLKETDRKKIYNNKKVCDHHFEPSCRTRGRRLMWSAVPTVNLNRVQKSLVTIVEIDHSYAHPRREVALVRPAVDINKLPDPQPAVVSLPGQSRSGPYSDVDATISPIHSPAMSDGDVQFNSKCRCCLQEGPAELSIFSANSSAVLYADMLRQCCSLEVLANDGKPSDICAECSVRLQASYYFKEMCLHTDKILTSEQHALNDGNDTESMMFEPFVVNVVSKDCSNDPLEEEEEVKLEEFEDATEQINTLLQQIKDAKMEEAIFAEVHADETSESPEFEFSDLITLGSDKSKITLKKERKATKCYNCNIKFATMEEYEIHMDQHNYDANFTPRYGCELCSKTYSLEEELELHVKKCHTHLCNTCKMTFDSKHKLGHHKLKTGHMVRGDKSKITLKKERKATKCFNCNINFATTEEYESHMEQHSYDANFTPHFGCELCSKSYSLDEELELHLKKCHTHLCNTCKMTFDSKPKLGYHKLKTGHMVRVRSESSPACKCELCEKRFRTRDMLSEHIDWVHRGVKFFCHICGNSYTSQSKHMEMNHGKGKQCTICDTWLATKAQHRIHMTQKHRKRVQRCDCGGVLSSKTRDKHICRDKTLVCQFCAKIFKSTSSFSKHLRTHSKDKPYQCDICSSMFSDKAYLRRHRQRHTNPKNMKCHFCPSMFRNRKNLNAHITFVHKLDSKRHPCGVCGKLFRRSDHRNRHQRNVHRVLDKTFERCTQPELNAFG